MSAHLPPAQQAQLALQAQSGDGDASQKLLQSNVGLIDHWAKKYVGKGVEAEDLMQEGRIGMLRAIKGFEPDHGASFATYASWWIRQAMGRACERYGSTSTFGMQLPSAVCNARLRVEDEECQDFATQQARRLEQQGEAVRFSDPQVLQGLTQQSAQIAMSLPLMRSVLQQSCGHMNKGWRPGSELKKRCSEVSARCLTAPLADASGSWWMLYRAPASSWCIEILHSSGWLSLPRAVGRLEDEELEGLLVLADLVALCAAETCGQCR
jgi:RNA polymerase sigma factor (sigma-70 family)